VEQDMKAAVSERARTMPEQAEAQNF
jgi:hypothetical protein